MTLLMRDQRNVEKGKDKLSQLIARFPTPKILKFASPLFIRLAFLLVTNLMDFLSIQENRAGGCVVNEYPL